MITRREVNSGLMSAAILSAASTSTARDATERQLPPPRLDAGKPLMQALKLRRSTREYSDRPISDQVLSDLLWAAFGINRPSGERTAPYWCHLMVIDVYTAMADGVWLYEPQRHALIYRDSRISLVTRRSTSSTWRMASACMTFRRMNGGSTPFRGRSTTKSSTAYCNFARTNSSPLPRPSVTRLGEYLNR